MRVSDTQGPSNPNENDLIARMSSGDEAAMTDLYDRYSGIVYGVALRVLRDTSAAEDVLQEVFLQLWRNPGSFDSSRGQLSAWLAVIARNRAIDHLRRRPLEDNIEDLAVSTGVNLENEAARRETATRVRAVISQLPPEQRKTLEMAYFEGMTHTEIASKLGEPLGTVKTRIRTALLALRKAFA
jgi:RNA polymerase sigma-70 factor, ECF subfamily